MIRKFYLRIYIDTQWDRDSTAYVWERLLFAAEVILL